MLKVFLSLLMVVSALSAMADDYDKIFTRLNELDKKPNTTLFSLGKNDQGRDIMGVVLGDAAKATKKHLVVGTHHGNERMSAEVPLLFADAMLTVMKDDEAYFVIPVLNISGYNKNRREESDANDMTHDSNRDYEDACATKNDFQLKSTTLLAQIVDQENIIAAVTVHGYVGTFTYPWGTNTRNYESLDDSFMTSWAKQAVKMNGYKTGTHGGAIYPAAGAFEDWAYYKLGVWSFLIELKSASTDLKKDAQALVEFFRLAPSERSKNVGQHVNCIDRLLKNRDIARP